MKTNKETASAKTEHFENQKIAGDNFYCCSKQSCEMKQVLEKYSVRDVVRNELIKCQMERNLNRY